MPWNTTSCGNEPEDQFTLLDKTGIQACFSWVPGIKDATPATLGSGTRRKTARESDDE
ncbi:MAG: hypothetical protein J0L73_27540 [Verrucomicrobia bacterium]|nr:hypothetical protein [Verrucomicrobiota bacterium]